MENRTALVIVDMQADLMHREFTLDHDGGQMQIRGLGNDFTDRAAENTKQLVEALKAEHPDVDIYLAYIHDPRRPKDWEPEFYKIEADDGKVVAKKVGVDSVFSGGQLEQDVNRSNYENVAFAGVNTSACVEKSVVDALGIWGEQSGYGQGEYQNVFILRDCVANNNDIIRGYGFKDTDNIADSTLRRLEEEGAKIIDASSFLDFLQPPPTLTSEIPADLSETSEFSTPSA